jgi:CBS domain-containing protein
MTKDVVSVSVGSSVRDVAILLLEKRISAVPVLAANLELLGMVSEGDLMGRSDTDRVARRDWWLTLLKDFQPQTETIAALAARPVEQVVRAPVLTIEARAPSRATPARTSPLISASVSTRSKTIATRSAESPIGADPRIPGNGIADATLTIICEVQSVRARAWLRGLTSLAMRIIRLSPRSRR